MADPNLILSAVMYSPNLGDGVIAECFTRNAPAPISWLDLAGRTGFVAPSGSARARVMSVLDALPGPASNLLAETLVKAQIQQKLRPRLAEALPGARGVVFGGGQIFADAHMNFPLKLSAACSAARCHGIPVAIHGVGVSRRWSPRARNHFASLFAAPFRHVAVRDAASRANLHRHLSDAGVKIPDIHVFPDAGFLASTVVDKSRHANGSIGLGITHPAPLIAHGTGGLGANAAEFASRFSDLAQHLAASGSTVTLFTNGAAEDEAFLERVLATLPSDMANGRIHQAARCQSPIELMQLISGFEALISHRMHANIIAYSYKVPHVGLGWDAKMEACFDLMGRRQALLDGCLQDPRQIAEVALLEAANPAFDDILHRMIQRGAAEGIAEAISAFGPPNARKSNTFARTTRMGCESFAGTRQRF